MKTRARITAIGMALGLTFGAGPGRSDPDRPASPPAESPWAAHLDVTKLQDSPLGTFLVETLGFDHVREVQDALKEELKLDLSMIESVTLSGAGERWQESAIALRGKFEAVDLSALPVVQDAGLLRQARIHRGPRTHGTALFLARLSAREMVAGTSLEAIRDSLDLLETKRTSWEQAGLVDHVRTELAGASAALALDMDRIGAELQFEADLTRSMRRAWLLAGTRGKEVEVTVLVDSTGGEGLNYLRDQLGILTAMFMAGEGVPPEWLELVQALKIDTRGHWLTLKVSAPPEKATRFLRSLAPLFQEEPGAESGTARPASTD
jgi:hypothetical protein